MIQLLKKQGANVHYWNGWIENKKAMIHQGIVGTYSAPQQVEVDLLNQPEAVLNVMLEEKLKQGFEYLDEDQLTDIMIQYRIDGFGTEQDIDKRHSIEEFLEESLDLRGNGHCDGGDTGSGTMNVYCLVVSIDVAIKTIMEELTRHDCLEGAVIAYKKDDDYEVVYPEGEQLVF